MNFYAHFPHLLTDLVETWCNFPYKAVRFNFHGDRIIEGHTLLMEQIKRVSYYIFCIRFGYNSLREMSIELYSVWLGQGHNSVRSINKAFDILPTCIIQFGQTAM